MRTLFLLLCLFPICLAAQTMSFEEYEPKSSLVVPEHLVTRAKFPFIDVHNHQFNMPTQDLQQVVADMNKLNMAVMVNLSGRGFRQIQHADGSTSFGHQDSAFLTAALVNAK